MKYPDNCRPKRSTRGSAGYDFYAANDIKISRWRWTKIHTGVYIDGTERPEVSTGISYAKTRDDREIYLTNRVPMDSWFLKVYPRSSHGVKYKVRFSTSAIIDQDYRDEIILELKAEKTFTIKAGDKYAQGIFMPYLVLDDEDIPTEERTGGFGSTDKVTKV